GSVSSTRDDGGGGGGGGATLDTVTATGLDVNCSPSTFRATAVSVCEPLLAVVVSHETEYGALVSAAPRLAPSSRNWTLWAVRRPMIVALALTGTVPETVDPLTGEVIVTIRLPTCASAEVEVQENVEIANSVITLLRSIVFSMGTRLLVEC